MNYDNLSHWKYNAERTHKVSFWIESQKKNTSEVEKIPRKVINTNLLNKRQRLAYDIVVKNLNNNKQLLMIVTDQSGSCKSFLIDNLCQLNGSMFVYELSGCGFEFRCSHLNFRFRACFEQGVP